MSFLLGDDYGSSSSSSDEESEHEFELDAALPRSEPKQSDGGAALALLPSADSVLAGVSASSASFLAPQSAQSAAAIIVEIDVFKENERAKALQASEKASERQSRRDEFAPSTDELAKKRPRTATEAGEKASAKEKDAKERVKAQRTKGQAGIGSDFRSWKSETEMSMRQQFD